MKITQEILSKKLEILCKAMGKTCGYDEVQWFLDYYGLGGGYVIVENGDNGSQSHPLLNKRLPASQMADALDMAICVAIHLYIEKEE